MQPDFQVYFHRKQQWLDVYIEDVTPETFARHDGGRWAYFSYTRPHTRTGLFGDLHFVKSRLRQDVVAHELLHVLLQLIESRNGALNERTEEHWCLQYDSLTRAFWKAYKRK